MERQFSGVMMTPANWQAQWMVAASPAVLQHRDEMIAGREPERVEARHQGRDAPVPIAVGQAHIAVDDRQRLRIARDARQKAGAEIKHLLLFLGPDMPAGRDTSWRRHRRGDTSLWRHVH